MASGVKHHDSFQTKRGCRPVARDSGTWQQSAGPSRRQDNTPSYKSVFRTGDRTSLPRIVSDPVLVYTSRDSRPNPEAHDDPPTQIHVPSPLHNPPAQFIYPPSHPYIVHITSSRHQPTGLGALPSPVTSPAAEASAFTHTIKHQRTGRSMQTRPSRTTPTIATNQALLFSLSS